MTNSRNFKIDVLISETEMKEIIHNLAVNIYQDFKDEEVVFVGILNGAFVFLYELTRELQKLGMKEMIIDFMAMDTYGANSESSQDPKVTKDLKQDIRGKTVVIVEDIVDSGFSLSILQAMLNARNPKSLHTVAMLSKDERREIDVPVDYVGRHIPNKFVVGYGLDYEGKYYRELPYVGVVRFEN